METNLLKTTFPYGPDSARRNQCVECGGWQYEGERSKGLLPGEILHSKRCDSRPQIQSVADALAAREAAKSARRSGGRLADVAAQVRSTRTAGDATQDEIVDAVRLGFLSQSDAMNRDD